MKAMTNDSLQLVVQELFDRKIERGTIKISGERTVSFTPKIDQVFTKKMVHLSTMYDTIKSNWDNRGGRIENAAI